MARTLIALVIVSLLLGGIWWYRSSGTFSSSVQTEMPDAREQAIESTPNANDVQPTVSKAQSNSNIDKTAAKSDATTLNDAASENEMESAMQSMQQSLKSGDTRTPELAPQYEREKPSPEALADPERYAEYEAGQTRNVASVYLSILSQIPTLRARIDAARTSGSKTAEELAEAEEALAKLEALQKEMEATHPDILKQQGQPTNPQTPVDNDVPANSATDSTP